MFDVPRVMVTGRVTAAGSPLVGGGELEFEETTTGERFHVTTTSDGTFNNGLNGSAGVAIPVAPGSYRATYAPSRHNGSDPVVQNHPLGCFVIP